MPAANIRIFKRWRSDAYDACADSGQLAAKAGIDKQLLELDQVARLADQWLRLLRAVSHPARPRASALPADKLNLVVVWREAPQFSSA